MNALIKKAFIKEEMKFHNIKKAKHYTSIRILKIWEILKCFPSSIHQAYI